MTTLFRVVAVKLVNGSRSVDTYAFLDSGSSSTLMSADLAKQLGVSGPAEPLRLGWLNGSTQFVSQRVCVTIEVPGRGCENMVVNTVDKLSLPRHTVTKDLIQSEELSSFPIAYVSGVVPQILIGQDQAELTRSMRTVVGKSGRVVASQTPLGWVVEGQQEGESDRHCMIVTTDQPADLNEVVHRYIESESFGLGPDDAVIFDSDENARARIKMEDSTIFLGDRYETGLLWKEPPVALPDNKEMALRRHRSFIHGLKRKPDEYKQVAEIIQGIILFGQVIIIFRAGSK